MLPYMCLAKEMKSAFKEKRSHVYEKDTTGSALQVDRLSCHTSEPATVRYGRMHDFRTVRLDSVDTAGEHHPAIKL